MSAAGAVARGREARVRLGMFPSTATVRRTTGRTTQDESTGLEVPVWAVVYSGPCRFVGGATRTVTIAGVEQQVETAEVHFPHDTTDLADGDLVEMTAGEWSGTVLSIVEAVKGDQRTARRVPVVQHDRPSEWEG